MNPPEHSKNPELRTYDLGLTQHYYIPVLRKWRDDYLSSFASFGFKNFERSLLSLLSIIYIKKYFLGALSSWIEPFLVKFWENWEIIIWVHLSYLGSKNSSGHALLSLLSIIFNSKNKYFWGDLEIIILKFLLFSRRLQIQNHKLQWELKMIIKSTIWWYQYW